MRLADVVVDKLAAAHKQIQYLRNNITEDNPEVRRVVKEIDTVCEEVRASIDRLAEKPISGIVAPVSPLPKVRGKVEKPTVAAKPATNKT